jgi:hypothetical protein
MARTLRIVPWIRWAIAMKGRRDSEVGSAELRDVSAARDLEREVRVGALV